MKQNIKKQLKDAKGFTIIEVALVLAIAGLIFLVVFLALPALQRSQRDTARRQDAGRIISALQNCMSDNQADLTNCYATGGGGIDGPVGTSGYLGGKLSQITTIDTKKSVPPEATDKTTANVVRGGTCSSATAATIGDTSKNAAVFVSIESGTSYCASL